MVASSEGSRARMLRKDELDSLLDWLVGLVFVKDSLLLPYTQFACILLRFLSFCFLPSALSASNLAEGTE